MSKIKENVCKNLQTILDNSQLCDQMTFAQRSAIRVAIAMINSDTEAVVRCEKEV